MAGSVPDTAKGGRQTNDASHFTRFAAFGSETVQAPAAPNWYTLNCLRPPPSVRQPFSPFDLALEILGACSSLQSFSLSSLSSPPFTMSMK